MRSGALPLTVQYAGVTAYQVCEVTEWQSRSFVVGRGDPSQAGLRT